MNKFMQRMRSYLHSVVGARLNEKDVRERESAFYATAASTTESEKSVWPTTSARAANMVIPLSPKINDVSYPDVDGELICEYHLQKSTLDSNYWVYRCVLEGAGDMAGLFRFTSYVRIPRAITNASMRLTHVRKMIRVRYPNAKVIKFNYLTKAQLHNRRLEEERQYEAAQQEKEDRKRKVMK